MSPSAGMTRIRFNGRRPAPSQPTLGSRVGPEYRSSTRSHHHGWSERPWPESRASEQPKEGRYPNAFRRDAAGASRRSESARSRTTRSGFVSPARPSSTGPIRSGSNGASARGGERRTRSGQAAVWWIFHPTRKHSGSTARQEPVVICHSTGGPDVTNARVGVLGRIRAFYTSTIAVRVRRSRLRSAALTLRGPIEPADRRLLASHLVGSARRVPRRRPASLTPPTPLQ